MATNKLSEITALERRVWDALTSGDRLADVSLLSEDFLGVYESGFSDRAGHVRQLDDGPTMATYELSDFHMLTPAPGLAMLCYRAEFLRLGRTVPEAMMISSLWKQTGSDWLNIFSQDTTVIVSEPEIAK